MTVTDAPRPATGLTAAIVGHRLNRIADPLAVQARLEAILRTIDTALRSLAGDPASPRLRLISALAEGADQLAVMAATAAGLDWDAVLPFPVDEYEHDFSAGAVREGFRALLTQAGSVLVLDGHGIGPTRDRAYDAAGKALLDNCDILIAVWDGLPGRGRGGTRDVVEEAVRRGTPIVSLTPDGGAAVLRLSPPSVNGNVRLEDLIEASLDGLPDLIGQIVGETVAPPWPPLMSSPRPSWNYSAYPLLLSLVGLGKSRGKGPAPAEQVAAPVTGALEQAFAWWDEAAVVAAQAFRSAVIVNFALAAVAVGMAALSLFAGDGKWIFVLAEVATIMVLLGNTTLAGRRRWQERWLESREMAELLRVCLMLRKVGLGRGMAATEDPGWKAWYVQALARSQRLEPADLSNAAATSCDLVAEVSDQAAWNEATAHRMHLAGHRIERFGETLFVLVLAAAIGWLILRLVNPHAAHELTYTLTAITAGLPAVATASYGIGVILDFEGIADRSGRMAAALRASLAGWDPTRANVAELQGVARQAADIMLGDVAAWRLLAQGRRLKIPG